MPDAPNIPPSPPERPSPRRPVAAAAATLAAMLVGLYTPALSAAWWMWGGGQMSPVASLLFTATPPAAWLLWLRALRRTAPPQTPGARGAVVVTAAATVMYMAVTTWDVSVGVAPSSVSVWPPALAATAVGGGTVIYRAGRLWRQ